MMSTHVLIIEDDPDNQAIIRRFLEFAGYCTSVASDGPSGLSFALRERPNLIILDLHLPAVDGWMIGKQLKEDSRTASIPVLFITASPFDYQQIQELLAKRDAIMLKPFDLHMFLHQIAHMSASGTATSIEAEQLREKSVGEA